MELYSLHKPTGEILKDGHTMFGEDVVKELNAARRNRLQDQQKIEELEKRVLRAENIFYQLIEEEGCYCSDFNNLLPPEDQDSKVVADAINFMNDHIVKFKDNKQ